jgi:hypothetical protein
MAYSCDLAKLLADQLSRFSTLNRHQLAGQVANLDFWRGEVRHVLDVLDGYPARFAGMRRAQAQYVVEHRTREFDLDDPDARHYEAHTAPPAPLKRVPDAVFREARDGLCRAVDRFLSRCVRERFLDEPTVRRTREALGIRVDLRT